RAVFVMKRISERLRKNAREEWTGRKSSAGSAKPVPRRNQASRIPRPRFSSDRKISLFLRSSRNLVPHLRIDLHQRELQSFHHPLRAPQVQPQLDGIDLHTDHYPFSLDELLDTVGQLQLSPLARRRYNERVEDLFREDVHRHDGEVRPR